MDRRYFLQGGICSALTLPIVTPALASTAIVLRRNALIFSETSYARANAHAHMEFVFRHTFEKLTSVRTERHVAAPMAKTYAEVVEGRCDVSIGFIHDAATQHPAFGYFAGLPCSMGLPSAKQAVWINAGGGQELWNQLGSELGIKPLFAGHVESYAVAFHSRRKIRNASHFQNMRVQATGLVRDVVAGLGATPVISETAEEIDAVQLGMCPSQFAFDASKSQSHFMSGGFLPHGSTLAVSVRLKTWEQLSRFEQQAMQMAAYVAAAAYKDYADTRHRMTDGTSGVRKTFTPHMPVDVTTVANRISEAVVADIASTDQLSARINHSYLAAQSRHHI